MATLNGLSNEQLDALGRRVVLRNRLDVVHDAGSARVWVGSCSGAEDIADLKAKGIRRVVNCMDEVDRYPDHDDIDVMFFPISGILGKLGGLGAKPAAVLQRFLPFFKYVDDAVRAGESVLIHCLAGAHRAGTAGVAYLLYTTAYGPAATAPGGMTRQEAIALAQQRRPVINPIGNFPRLLELLEKGLRAAAAPGA